MSGSNNYRHILAIELSISHLAPVDRSANSLTLGYPQAAFLRRVGSPRIKKRQDRCTPTSRFDRGKSIEYYRSGAIPTHNISIRL
jgi:hypothetical protein